MFRLSLKTLLFSTFSDSVSQTGRETVKLSVNDKKGDEINVARVETSDVEPEKAKRRSETPRIRVFFSLSRGRNQTRSIKVISSDEPSRGDGVCVCGRGGTTFTEPRGKHPPLHLSVSLLTQKKKRKEKRGDQVFLRILQMISAGVRSFSEKQVFFLRSAENAEYHGQKERKRKSEQLKDIRLSFSLYCVGIKKKVLRREVSSRKKR